MIPETLSIEYKQTLSDVFYLQKAPLLIFIQLIWLNTKKTIPLRVGS